MNVAPLFSVLYIVGYCDMVKLIMWSKPVCALLCRLPEQESPPCMVRIGRRGHPHRSTQTSASVDADIRIGRRRHPHRSAQTSASVGADICIGRRRCINRRVWHPCHTHAATPRHPHAVTSMQPPLRSHIISRLCGGVCQKSEAVRPEGAAPHSPRQRLGLKGTHKPYAL